MKKFVRKRTVLLMLICLCTGFFFAYTIFIAPKNNNHPWVIAKTNDSSTKFITKETIVNQIKKKQKFITTEVNLTEKITIDNSWWDFSIFKKIQNINFVGIGYYSVDLSNLTSKNVSIQGNTISITLSKPTIDMVSINENKTTYDATENGLFRFGDIKMSAADHETLRRNVEEKMKDKMLEDKYYNTALQNSKKAMENLITAINNMHNNYAIKIIFN